MIDVKEQLKDIPIRDVVESLGLPLKSHGTALLGDCPTGHESKGHKCFGVNLEGNYYHCFHCGVAGDVISLVELVKGVGFKDALRWLAEECKPDLLPLIDRYKGEGDPRQREYYQRASLYDFIYEYGKDLLYKPQGEEALAYLTTVRGYTVENLKQTEWMYNPPDDKLRSYLRKEHPEMTSLIDSLPAFKHYFGFISSFPYRDRRGTITGFLLRNKGQTGPRWDSVGGTEKHDLFNLCRCKGRDTLVIVEGYPDAMYLPTLGLKNVVAVGQGLLSKNHLQGLQAFKVKRVILSFDNDPPKEDGTITGVENTEKALDLLKDTGIRAFVIDPPLLSPHKDPDELVKAQGIDVFKALVDNPQVGATWLAAHWAKQYDLSQDLDRKTYIEKAIEFDAGIPAVQATDGEDLLKKVAELTGYDLDSLMAERKGIQEKKARGELEKGYRDLSRDIERLLNDGKVSDIPGLLDERSKALRSVVVTRRDPFYHYESLQHELSAMIPGLETGFKDLDQYIRIPQEAVTIVAARPSHGKTTFLMNLLVNLIGLNPDKHFFFFSYEENRKKLAVKLINILAGVVVAEGLKGFNVSQIENYIRGNNRGNIGLNEGIEKYEGFVASHRLGLMDEHFYIDDLTDYIGALTEGYDTGAILIDYIQKVKSQGRYQSRQLELQDISRQLSEASLAYKVPIVLGAQFNREVTTQEEMDLGKLREAGDIEQDSNLVLGLWCEAKSKEHKQKEKTYHRTVDLAVVVLKDREDESEKTARLKFDRTILRLKDGGEPRQPWVT